MTISSSAAVSITGISSDNSDFTVGTPSATLPDALAAGGSVTVPITFSPTTALPEAAVLTLTMTGGALSQQTIGLSGTGEYATGHPVFTPETIDFGNAALNSSTQSESAVLSNNGAKALTITGGQPAAGPLLGVQPAGRPGPRWPPAGASSIPITFTPDVVGNSLSGLTVDTNDGNVTLELTGGTGYPPTLEVGPQTLDFGNVPVGSTEVRTFTITNTGSTAAAITLSKPPVTSAGVRRGLLAARGHHHRRRGQRDRDGLLHPADHRGGQRRVDH